MASPTRPRRHADGLASTPFSLAKVEPTPNRQARAQSTTSAASLRLLPFTRGLHRHNADFSKRPGNLLGMLHRAVVPKLKLGNLAHPQTRFQVVADESRRRAKRFQRFLALVIGSQYADVDGGMTKIGSDVNAGHAHKADSRIFHLAPDDVRELFAKKLPHLSCSSG